MLGINCLLDNPEILPKLGQLVEYTALQLVEEGEDKTATLPSVYNSLRRAGLEVDLQTVANLYRNQLDLTDPSFSSSDEVSKILMEDINKRVNVRALRMQQLGKNAPANEAVLKIIDAIQQVSKLPPVKTIQKQMQDRLIASARKILGESPEGQEVLKKSKYSNEDVYKHLKDALLLEKNNKFGDFGYMKNAMDLFEDFKNQMNKMADTMGNLDAYAAEQIKLAASVIANSGYQLMLSKSETRSVLNNALKDSGVTKVTNTGNVIVDWNEVVKKEGRDVISSVRRALAEKGFSEDDLNSIMPALESEYNFFLEKKIENELKDKGINHKMLGKLANLAANNPGAWNNAENNELLRTLGVPMADKEAIDNIRKIMSIYNLVIKSSPQVSFATTYINTIEREVRNMLERSVEQSANTSAWLKAARKFQIASQFAQSTILANPGNVPENFFSGVATVIEAAFSNPQHFGKLFEAGLMSGLSVTTGGVRVGRENTNPNNLNVNLEDRTTGHRGKTAKWLINQWQRLSLSATDSMFGQYVMSSVELRVIRFMLQTKAGLSKSEANKVINDMYYQNSDELSRIAEFLLGEYDKLGLKYNAKAEKARLINDMYLSNFLSDGIIWQDFVDKYKTSQKQDELIIGNKLSNTSLNQDLLLLIRNASDAVRGKAMGHRSDTLAGKMFEKIYQIGVEDSIVEAKNKGQQKKQAFYEFVRGSLGNALFARRGSLNWAFLILQRSTGLGLATTLIHDVLFTKMGANLGGKSFLTKRKAAELYSKINSAKTPKDLSEYMDELREGIEYNESVRQRLFRSTVGPIITGSIALAIWKVMEADCEDGTDECLQNKFEEWQKRGYLRAFEQMLPYVMNGYIDDQFDKFGKIKNADERASNPAEYLGKTMGINNFDASKIFDLYSRYADKNRIFDDNLFGTIFHLLNPPKYIQPYDYAEYRSAAVGQMLGSFTGARHLKVVDVWGDRVKAYGFALGLYDPGMSAQQQKDKRKELYAKGAYEGFLNQILERNVYRWYLENYGHLEPDYKLKQSVETIGGVGPVKKKELEKNNIFSINDLKGKTQQQLLELRNDKGERIFSKRESIAMDNILNNNNSYGGRDFGDYKITNDEYKILKSIGYFSVGKSNLESIKKDLTIIYQGSEDDTKEKINSIFDKLKSVK